MATSYTTNKLETSSQLRCRLSKAPLLYKLLDLWGRAALPESSQLLEQKDHQRFQLCKDIHIIYQKRSRSAVSDERAARLVDIIDIGSTVNLRLVDGSIECTPYVALSYRWGGLEAVWQTTTSNLESRSSGFSIDELPKTLSNTVKVTHDLGFKWIWINSLCIVQDDKDD
ncbi:unnamed protein product [Fusarium graminearum]|nr:unnamed protein product [Fusarium graminearum]